MDALKKLREDAARAHSAMKSAIAEADTVRTEMLEAPDDKRDALRSRFQELELQAKRAIDDQRSIEESIKLRQDADEVSEREAAARLARQPDPEQVLHGRSNHGRPKADRDHRATVEELLERDLLAQRAFEGGIRKLTEEEAVTAMRQFPQEDLFQKAALIAADKIDRDAWRPGEEEAWREYQRNLAAARTEIMNRSSIAGGQTTAAADGGKLIPTLYAERIWELSKNAGPMAAFERMTVVTVPGTNSMTFRKYTDAQDKEGSAVAEAANAPVIKHAADDETLTPRRRQYYTVESKEFMSSTAFDAWFTGQAARGLGRTINKELTTGAGGANAAEGLLTGSIGTVAIAANTAIARDDIKNLVKALEDFYRYLPGTVVQVHPDWHLELAWALNAVSGLPEFRTTGDGTSPILPGGVPVLANPDITSALNNAANRVGVVSFMENYIVVRGLSGSLEFEAGNLIRSQQRELSVVTFFDGARIFDSTTKALIGK